MNCSRYCWLSGESHFKTFDDKYFNFDGKCAYNLLTADRFSVSVESVDCDLTGVVCSRSITIQVGITSQHNISKLGKNINYYTTVHVLQVFEDMLEITYATENTLIINRNMTLTLGPDGYLELPEYGVIFSVGGLFQIINIEKLGLTIMSDMGTLQILT